MNLAKFLKCALAVFIITAMLMIMVSMYYLLGSMQTLVHMNPAEAAIAMVIAVAVISILGISVVNVFINTKDGPQLKKPMPLTKG